MADYEKAAAGLKTRLDARKKRRLDLDEHFEALRICVDSEVSKANAALSSLNVRTIDVRRESLGEPTIQFGWGNAICRLTQDRSVPSISAAITSEAGDKTVTFLLLPDVLPIAAQRVSLTPETEPKLDPAGIAATLVEELIVILP